MKRSTLLLILVVITISIIILLQKTCSPKTELTLPIQEPIPIPVQSDTISVVSDEVIDEPVKDDVSAEESPIRKIITSSNPPRLPQSDTKSYIFEKSEEQTKTIPSQDNEIVDVTLPDPVEVIETIQPPIESNTEPPPSRYNNNNQLSHIIFIGAGFSQFIATEGPDNYNNVISYNAGVAVDIPLAQTPSIIELGIRFIDRSSQEDVINYTRGNDTIEYLYSLQFLDLFVKAKYHIPLGSSFSLQPYAGYIASILLNAQHKEVKPNKETTNAMDSYNSVYPLLLLGADFVIHRKYNVGIEYNMGLSNIYFTSKEHKARNDSMYINLGYRF